MQKTTFAPKAKEQRQEALLEAANAVFAERGFDAATTREIAERAGCAEGLIHRYFAGKRGLLLAILDHKAPAVADDFAADLPLADSVQAEIEQILRHEIDAKWAKRDFMRVCMSQAAIDPELGAAIRDRVQDRIVAVIARRLRAHKESGRICDNVDLESIAEIIAGLGFATGFMRQVAFGVPREHCIEIAIMAANALTNGIAPTTLAQDTKETPQ